MCPGSREGNLTRGAVSSVRICRFLGPGLGELLGVRVSFKDPGLRLLPQTIFCYFPIFNPFAQETASAWVAKLEVSIWACRV